ncbi:hypothetical protein B0H13DRAFT_2383722 [Mycena leptocephala]|nr:hypothetical protein B0H13DRAFT_2383722 [Mycena leptocephala]
MNVYVRVKGPTEILPLVPLEEAFAANVNCVGPPSEAYLLGGRWGGLVVVDCRLSLLSSRLTSFVLPWMDRPLGPHQPPGPSATPPTKTSSAAARPPHRPVPQPPKARMPLTQIQIHKDTTPPNQYQRPPAPAPAYQAQVAMSSASPAPPHYAPPQSGECGDWRWGGAGH